MTESFHCLRDVHTFFVLAETDVVYHLKYLTVCPGYYSVRRIMLTSKACISEVNVKVSTPAASEICTISHISLMTVFSLIFK